MTGWLIYDAFEAERNRAYIESYFASAKKRGVDLSLLLLEDMCWEPELLVSGHVRKLPDFVICRRPVPSLSEKLESLGVPVFNNSRISRICNNKYLTSRTVAGLGVPVAEEYWHGCGLPACPPELPCVAKPVDGHGGQGVFLCRDAAEYAAAAESLAGRECVLQRPVSDLGRDLRVYMLGCEPVAACLRISDTDFRSNFCLGGRAELHTLTAEERDYVLRIAAEFDFGLAGIDFIYDGGRPVFNEIEDVVGARMLYALTDIDIADRYLAFILEKISH
ncbi:MAG: ATP-grasp domain-containing protein [Clostridia bacterium]|nr:ATP-grasp domain-containing protein [Clostridia bacterium]